MEQLFDVAVIGGGINGCGTAADAALRGLSVILLEKDDLASKTSSSSSKLIHGGLRYLEYCDFGLVKKALDERQTLLTLAPYLVHPLSFMLPYQENMRPAWLLRTGLFLYDHLSRRNKLSKSKFIRREVSSSYFFPLAERFKKGFLFSDCITDDARLTLANALQAREYGAAVYPRTEVIKAEASDKVWQLTVQNKQREQRIIHAKAIINATGPWAEKINEKLQIPNKFSLSLVKGSHLLVHKLYEGNHAYLLQHDDKRIVFIIPYHGYTMIGTTDIAFEGDLDNIRISSEEINYLSKLVNNYLACKLQPKDIITTWSGVRPLLSTAEKDLKALSRDYALCYTDTPAPAVTIYGGKITTYRQSALETVNQLKRLFPDLKKSQTVFTPLPGSTLGSLSFNEYLIEAAKKYHWLDKTVKERYFLGYGTRTEQLLKNCSQMADLGEHFGHGLYQIEVDFLRREEWAMTCDDLLWRRSKLGLNFTIAEKQALTAYLSRSYEKAIS